MITRFFLYGFTGHLMEIIFTGISSLYLKGDTRLTGQTFLWMFPIYASAVWLEPVHDSIRFLPILIRGGIYLVLIWGVEFIAGWAIKKMIGKCPWDYSETTNHSLCGYIRWDFAPCWFMVGLLFEKYHDFLVKIFP